jgi:hypothetical protein
MSHRSTSGAYHCTLECRISRSQTSFLYHQFFTQTFRSDLYAEDEQFLDAARDDEASKTAQCAPWDCGSKS